MRKICLICLLLLLLLLTACQRAQDPVVSEPVAAQDDANNSNPEFLNSEEFEALGLPFSEAVQVGNLLYLSGQIGVLPGTVDLVAGGVEAETRQTMENIKATVEGFGSSMDRVFKCTVFMADNAERSQINTIYSSYFPKNFPARSGVGSSGLALGARVEIECVASLPGDWKQRSERIQKRGSRRPFL